MGLIEAKVIEMDKLDPPTSQEPIFNILKELIYNGFTIDQIAKMSDCATSYTIISLLILFGKEDETLINAIKEYYSSKRIDSNKCLIIADTHIGRLCEDENPAVYNYPNVLYRNEYGLYNAYNYAIKNNIKKIIHLGDLIEGDPTLYQANRIKSKEQKEYLTRIYPRVPDITTYLLYGNHDYNAIRYDGLDHAFVKGCSGLDLIGINYSYVYFNGNLIKICHLSNKSKYIKSICLEHDFELGGHSHSFATEEARRYVSAPSLSCSSLDASIKGFLELNNEEDEYVFKFLDVNTNYLNEKVLTKTRKK